MNFKAKFQEQNGKFTASFKEINNVSDGGYESGYEQGYKQGYNKGNDDGYALGYEVGDINGYNKGKMDGYSQGLAERQYEVWTITLTDGSIVEKEVALL